MIVLPAFYALDPLNSLSVRSDGKINAHVIPGAAQREFQAAPAEKTSPIHSAKRFISVSTHPKETVWDPSSLCSSG
jgi:hypothetical protein